MFLGSLDKYSKLCVYEEKMIRSIGILSTRNANMAPNFGQSEEEKKEMPDNQLLLREREKHPISTSLKITTDKFQNALTVYPIKGLKGSRNANFYEFLTMGMVPYVVGSGMMIAAFNGVNKAFKLTDQANASVLGRKMALGVVAYGVVKNLSKKLIEAPLKAATGIDVSLPYRRKVNELPDSVNDTDLISHEYHKVFESADFPNWPLLYDSKYYGEDRNSYFDHIAKKMGYGENLKDSDQIMKPKIKEKVIQARTFATFSSYLWAAAAVGMAMQTPWDKLAKVHIKDSLLNYKAKLANVSDIPKTVVLDVVSGARRVTVNLAKDLKQSAKEFVQGGVGRKRSAGIAAKALLLSAAVVTVLGNIVTLTDFGKLKSKRAAAAPIIDDSKEKVVC